MSGLNRYPELTDEEIELIRASQIFNADWYVAAYPAVRDSELPPFEHYIKIGLQSDFEPGPTFRTKSYLYRYPDIRKSGACPILHYITFGGSENRDASEFTDKTFGLYTKDFLARLIDEYGYEVGDWTYGNPHVLESRNAKLKIGKYCSIGDGVLIITGNHRTDLVSTYPFRTRRDTWPEAASGKDDHTYKGDVEIGNDVWIGANCTILSGVCIGDGAVIGAGSVLRRSVPPYSICLGNPSQVVRMRFDETTVQRLLRVRWWDWPEEKISSFLPSMLDPNIEAFLNAAGV